jgi:hypothetical protein
VSAVAPSAAPRTKLARITKSRTAMVQRVQEIEARLAVLPTREAEARAAALRRNPESPAADDELVVQVTGERVELERELAELVANVAAADRVITEASAAAEAELRAEAVAQAQAFRAEEEVVWAETVKAWKAVTGCYEKLHAHQLRVAATRPSAYLEGEPPYVVSPTPVAFEAFLSLLVAASDPRNYEARIVDSGEILRGLVPAFTPPRAALSGDLPARREPIRP